MAVDYSEGNSQCDATQADRVLCMKSQDNGSLQDKVSNFKIGRDKKAIY